MARVSGLIEVLGQRRELGGCGTQAPGSGRAYGTASAALRGDGLRELLGEEYG